MGIVKAYTSLEQSKKLAKILPLESADFCYYKTGVTDNWMGIPEYQFEPMPHKDYSGESIGCWSLAALLNILHSKPKDTPSLSCGGYKDGKYTPDWYLYYEFENWDFLRTFADNPVDACYEMILKLHELKML